VGKYVGFFCYVSIERIYVKIVLCVIICCKLHIIMLLFCNIVVIGSLFHVSYFYVYAGISYSFFIFFSFNFDFWSFSLSLLIYILVFCY
jgi:hypothetical protein